MSSAVARAILDKSLGPYDLGGDSSDLCSIGRPYPVPSGKAHHGNRYLGLCCVGGVNGLDGGVDEGRFFLEDAVALGFRDAVAVGGCGLAVCCVWSASVGKMKEAQVARFFGG